MTVHLPLLDHVHGLNADDDNSRATKRLESQHRLCHYFDGSMVLLHDVVQVFVLAHQDVDVGVGLDTFNRCGVGTALVDGDLLRRILQVDGALQKATGRDPFPLGGQ